MRRAPKLLVSTIAVITPGLVHAADLPNRVAAPVFAAPLPVFTWTGFYAGLNAGYVFDSTSRVTVSGVTAANRQIDTYASPGRPSIDDDGFTGGGQIGYNYQIPNLLGGGIVAGIEADAAYTDLNRTEDFPTPRGADRLLRSELEFLGTVRGRVGYAFNQFLIYGTGGFAYGQVNNRAAFLDLATNSVTRFGGGRDDLRTGYAYGGGLEYALPTQSLLNFFHASTVTVKAEYLHYDLGSSNVTANPNPATNAIGAYNARFRVSGDLARAGLNYKF